MPERSEHESLFAVYGAIDQAVQRNPRQAATVGRFFHGYADGSAIGWYKQFHEFARHNGKELALPTTAEALDYLARTPPANGHMAARRIHALAVAARIAPDLDVGQPAQAVAAAHSVAGVVSGADDAPAQLAGLVIDDSTYASIGDWSKLVQRGVAAGVLHQNLAPHAAAPPCVGQLVNVHTRGDEFPAAELRTSFETTAVTAPQAERFLEPSNWPAACDFWCLMEQDGTTTRGTRVYHEIVSLNCATRDQISTWTAEAYLDFAFIHTANGARVSYQLDPAHTNRQIDVDEGSLSVQQVGNTVRVDTVKRIRFTYPFNGSSLAMVMCALGYANIAEKLVLDCAVQHADSASAGSRFPGTSPPRTAHRPRRSPPFKVQRPASAPRRELRSANDIMRDVIGEMKGMLDDYSAYYDDLYGRVGGNALKSDDLMKTYNDVYAKSVRRATTLAGHGVDMTKAMQSMCAALATQLANSTSPASAPPASGSPASAPPGSEPAPPGPAPAADGNGTRTEGEPQ